MGKKFIEIVAEYPAICPYPKYEGKPYFAIRYEENGEKFEGFGTYKLEVLSEYIRKYFIGEEQGKNNQIGIKPYKIGDKRETQILCPQCNYRFYSLIDGEKVAGNQSLYCPCCGQRIDWEEEETNENR